MVSRRLRLVESEVAMRHPSDRDEFEKTLPLSSRSLPVARLTMPAGSPEAFSAPAPSQPVPIARRAEASQGAGLLFFPSGPTTPQAAEHVEICLVEDAVSVTEKPKAWRAIEIWTKRRVYGLDASFTCIEVLSRETGQPEPKHTMLGARLSGGRRRNDGTQRFAFPLPLPGMEAAFSRGKKHGFTSPVERVVLRIRMLTTSGNSLEEAMAASEAASR
jgi:hypothetical protein